MALLSPMQIGTCMGVAKKGRSASTLVIWLQIPQIGLFMLVLVHFFCSVEIPAETLLDPSFNGQLFLKMGPLS